MRLPAVLLLLVATAAAVDENDLFVVRITTERAAFGGPARQTLAAVAVPVGEDGLLLAVGFALDPPDAEEQEAVRVTAVHPDGTESPAELVAGDQDLACTLLRLRAPKGKLPRPVALAGVPRAPGDEVVLLGRHGPVMRYAPRRTRAQVEAAVKEPQTLYALREQDPRWTGCVALTPEGELVGFVDTRPTVRDGSGILMGLGAQTVVVVPADAFSDVARTLPRTDRRRAWIGVNLAPFDEDKEAFFNTGADWNGALVTGVAEGSPGAKAGLRLHDLVQSIGPLEIRFEKLEDWAGMLRAVQRLPLEKPLPCRVVRFVRKADGSYEAHPLELTMVLEERPLDFEDAPETEFPEIGLKVKPLTDDWRRTRQLPAGTEGVVVTRTARASPAQLGGLQPDDLVLRVEDQAIGGTEDLGRVLGEARKAKRAKVVFFVRRGTETLFLALPTSW